MGEFEFVIHTGGRNHSKKQMQQEAMVLHNMKVKVRQIEVEKLGFIFNGSYYVQKHYNVYGSEIARLNDEEWQDRIDELKKVFNQ